MNMGKMGIINLFEQKQESKSKFVVVTDEGANFNRAYAMGLLEDIGGEFYKVERTIAEKYALTVISEWTGIMY